MMPGKSKGALISTTSLAIRMVGLVLLEVLILSVWLAIEPMHWQVVEHGSLSNEGVIESSHGECSIAEGVSPIFLLLIGLIHAALLLYGNVLCYQARAVVCLSLPNSGRALIHATLSARSRAQTRDSLHALPRPDTRLSPRSPALRHATLSTLSRLHTLEFVCVLVCAQPTKYHESKYLTFSFANNLQFTMIAVLLSVFLADQPVAFFIIKWVLTLTVSGGTIRAPRSNSWISSPSTPLPLSQSGAPKLAPDRTCVVMCGRHALPHAGPQDWPRALLAGWRGAAHQRGDEARAGHGAGYGTNGPLHQYVHGARGQSKGAGNEARDVTLQRAVEIL